MKRGKRTKLFHNHFPGFFLIRSKFSLTRLWNKAHSIIQSLTQRLKENSKSKTKEQTPVQKLVLSGPLLQTLQTPQTFGTDPPKRETFPQDIIPPETKAYTNWKTTASHYHFPGSNGEGTVHPISLTLALFHIIRSGQVTTHECNFGLNLTSPSHN